MDQGVNLYVIKQMMGHRAIKTTARYLHTSCQKIAWVVRSAGYNGRGAA